MVNDANLKTANRTTLRIMNRYRISLPLHRIMLEFECEHGKFGNHEYRQQGGNSIQKRNRLNYKTQSKCIVQKNFQTPHTKIVAAGVANPIKPSL
jgi:hypothetical protein